MRLCIRDNGHFGDDGYEILGNRSIKSSWVDATMAVTGLSTLPNQVDNNRDRKVISLRTSQLS